MRLLTLTIGLAACPFAATTAAQEPAQPSAASQGNAAAELGRAFLDQINSVRPSRDFVAARFTTRALQAENADKRAVALDVLARRSGGLELLSSSQPSARIVEMVVRTRTGARTGRIVLFASTQEPGKISDIYVFGARDPDKAMADKFPASALSNDEAVRAVQRRLDNLTSEGFFSGTVLIARGDKVLLREARGFADAATQTENRIDTRFNIASMGKMWTAAIVLRLAEQRMLSLDDTVAKWVPEYPHPQAAQTMSLAALLQHTAGVGPWDGHAADTPRTSAQAAATMAAPPSSPGRFSYSNAGYVLLAAAAERATGMSYEELVQRYIFDAAGMTQSGLWPVSAIVPNRARGYLRPADDPLGFGERHANEQYLGYGPDGSGGAFSTIDDLFKFHRALANGTILTPASFARMQNQTVPMTGAPRPSEYGLGLRIERCAGQPMLGHAGGGAGSGVSSTSYVSPDGSWTIIVLGNVDPEPETLAFDICELVNRG